MPEHIFVVLEHAHGAPTAAAYEAVSLCLSMQENIEASVVGIAVGPGAEKAADAASAKTGIDVIAVETASPYNGETMRHVLGLLAQMRKPAYIVAGGTSQGMDYGPGLAVRLGGSCISGVRGIQNTEEGLGFCPRGPSGQTACPGHGGVAANRAAVPAGRIQRPPMGTQGPRQNGDRRHSPAPAVHP